jgi:hypothetical protein
MLGNLNRYRTSQRTRLQAAPSQIIKISSSYDTMLKSLNKPLTKLASAPSYATTQKAQLKLMTANLDKLTAPTYISNKLTLPFVPFSFRFRRKTISEKRRKIEREKLSKQQRAYQASVGSAILGLTVTPQQARKQKLYLKKFTGMELRPVISSRNYGRSIAAKINKAFGFKVKKRKGRRKK